MYAGLHGGLNFTHETDVTEPVPFYIDTTFEVGGAFGGFFGYQLDNGIRFEGELTLRANGIDEVDGFPLDGDVSSVAFMGNLLYEFPTGPSIRPYLGLGVGFANVAMNDLSFGSFTFIDDDDTVFAYQFIGGIGIPLSPILTLTVDYRFFATEDPKFVDFAADVIEIEYQNSTVLVGIRSLF
jgi:opacity protein-like surface antigen